MTHFKDLNASLGPPFQALLHIADGRSLFGIDFLPSRNHLHHILFIHARERQVVSRVKTDDFTSTIYLLIQEIRLRLGQRALKSWKVVVKCLPYELEHSV
jgi:hypothetical protein